MRLTRHAVRAQARRALAFLRRQQALGARAPLHRAARAACRGRAVELRYADRPALLRAIHFLFDPVNNHWAETDGASIWLNTCKPYTPELLYKTLLHEALHGIARRGAHELSEAREHRMMEALDASLV